MRLLVLFLYSFFCFSLNAQTPISMEQKLETATTNEEKAKIYLQQAQSLNYSNIEEVIKMASKAISLSKNDFQTQADALQLIGNCNIIKGNYPEAKTTFLKIELIYKNELPENLVGLIKTYGSLGVVASEQNNYHEALYNYFKALKIAEKQQDKKMLIVLHNNIGVIYRDTKQPKNAEKSFQKSVKLQQETKDDNAGITFTNLATIAINNHDFVQGEKYLLQAKPFLKNLKDCRAWGEWYNNYGYFYYLQNSYSDAEKQLNEALKNFEAIEDQFGSADTYLLLANLYKSKNQTDNAILNAKKALELGEKLNVLDHKQKANELLSSLYEKNGNTTLAFQHFKNCAIQKDSLINEENAKKLADAQWNYAFQKQQVENQNAIKKATTQKWLIVLIAVLILISLFSYYLWKSKKQVKQKLSLEKELIEYEQKALHLQMNPHFVFNCLAAISSYVVQNKTEDATKYLAMFSKLMRFTLESSKESLITIDKEIESITQYLNLENLRLNKIFTFSIEKSFEIEDDMALPPMLLQPLVENAIMHGILPMQQKGNIKIVFYTNDNQLFIEVADDGIGIENSLKNKSEMPLHHSMAIEIVKKRLSMITKTQDNNASITFAQQAKGTLVKLILPVQYKE
jgi:Tfp pilus assembly protein PilF/two-component sensor histidine kinase